MIDWLREVCAPARVSDNSVLVIRPYRHHGMWVFDDASTNLVREPFVAGIPEIIDAEIRRSGIPMERAEAGFNLIFSKNPFPGSQVTLQRLHEESGGNWYEVEGDSSRKGWLCPALFRYFETAPDRLYAQCA